MACDILNKLYLEWASQSESLDIEISVCPSVKEGEKGEEKVFLRLIYLFKIYLLSSLSCSAFLSNKSG